MTPTTLLARLHRPEEIFMTDTTIAGQIHVLFGRNLKAARLKAGLSSEEVALRARTTVGYLDQIEGGTTYPDLDLIGRLAGVVGCEAYELLHDDAPRQHKSGVGAAAPQSR